MSRALDSVAWPAEASSAAFALLALSSLLFALPVLVLNMLPALLLDTVPALLLSVVPALLFAVPALVLDVLPVLLLFLLPTLLHTSVPVFNTREVEHSQCCRVRSILAAPR